MAKLKRRKKTRIAPKRKQRRKIKVVRRKPVKKLRKLTRKISSRQKIEEIASALSQNQAPQKQTPQKQVHQSLGQLLAIFKKSGSFEKVTAADEEIALSLASLYFKEVAKQGFKRSLEIDDIINSYFYALARIKRKSFESKEIMDAIDKQRDY